MRLRHDIWATNQRCLLGRRYQVHGPKNTCIARAQVYHVGMHGSCEDQVPSGSPMMWLKEELEESALSVGTDRCSSLA